MRSEGKVRHRFVQPEKRPDSLLSVAVRRRLVEELGVDGSRLTTSGYRASQPKDSNSTREGRARNRRVELVRQ